MAEREPTYAPDGATSGAASVKQPKHKAPESVRHITPNSMDRFINRELSWIRFNFRVLDEAANKRHPLLERVRFLSISASNLDEFYMVRVAGLKGQLRAGVSEVSQDGRTPRQQLADIEKEVQKLFEAQHKTWLDLEQELDRESIELVEPSELNKSEREWLEHQFTNEMFPILTPIAVDVAHPFPFIHNLGFTLVLKLRPRGKKTKEAEEKWALVPVPHQLERFIELPSPTIRFISLENVIAMFLDRLFPTFDTKVEGLFRVIRDGEMEIDEEAEDLVRTFESALKRRRRGLVVHLAVNADMSEDVKQFLVEEMSISEHEVVPIQGVIGLADIKSLIVSERPDLLFDPLNPRYPERVREFSGDIFAAIRSKDFVVHHPYESFDVVAQFVQQAASDPDVVAIKQTLYRTSSDSPIVKALIEAAEAGKSVTAVVELKARFDEEANIKWGRDLERAGANVVYGFMDKKTHAKMSLVVRRETGKLRSYAHLGTGNYHPVTAKIYTDLSFFTCDPALCRDAARIFNYMTGYADPEILERMAVSPFNIRGRIIEQIDREIAYAKDGTGGAIWAKMNSLVDPDIIDALYRASQEGVKIDLVVRGICCLRPGVPGLSDNISVKSIVGRFLEHSRIMVWGNGHPIPSAENEVFISSADWMPRNMDRRIEHYLPIENPTVHQQLLDQVMVANMIDTLQSWDLAATGDYVRVDPRERGEFSAHDYFITNPSLSGRGKALKKHYPKTPQISAKA